MSELAAFLLAQIEADEEAARRGLDGYTDEGWHTVDCGVHLGYWAETDCQCRYGARVLADCEAKKAIVAECYVADCIEDDLGTVMDRRRVTPYVGERILLALARPFAGRDGWRDEWGTNTQEAQT